MRGGEQLSVQHCNPGQQNTHKKKKVPGGTTKKVNWQQDSDLTMYKSSSQTPL